MERPPLKPTTAPPPVNTGSDPFERTWSRISREEHARRVSLRHDMLLINFDVIVEFADGSAQTIGVQARDALSAIGTASVAAAQEWPPQRLNSISRVTWIKA